MNFTCDVDVLDDVKNIVVVDLPFPLGLQDVVHGAPDLTILLQRLPAFIIQETCILIFEQEKQLI
jgi:hypothetical protein